MQEAAKRFNECGSLNVEWNDKFASEQNSGHTVYSHFKIEATAECSLSKKLDCMVYVGERSVMAEERAEGERLSDNR